jgi:hypothetical protein
VSTAYKPISQTTIGSNRHPIKADGPGGHFDEDNARSLVKSSFASLG